MNFDFETSRVDCISKKNITLISVYEKSTSQSLEIPSHSPTVFNKKNIKNKIYTYAFGLCKQNIVFPYIQVDNKLIILPWTALNS